MKNCIKMYGMILAALTVLLLLVSSVAVATAEEDVNIYIPTTVNVSEETFLRVLKKLEGDQCYIKVSQTDELMLAVICYGPETPDEYTIDMIVYNKSQRNVLWIGGDTDITTENLQTMEAIGLENPKQYIHEDELLGFDLFKILRIGEEIIDWR